MIYILVGKIASGKTTWAQAKQKEGAVILSHDELMLLLADACEGRAAHVDRAKRISLYFAGLCEQFNQLGIDAVLDYGFWTKRERDLICQELAKRQIPYEMNYITCEEHLRLERLEARNREMRQKDEHTYVIDASLRERLDTFFEEPDKEEKVKIVRMD